MKFWCQCQFIEKLYCFKVIFAFFKDLDRLLRKIEVKESLREQLSWGNKCYYLLLHLFLFLLFADPAVSVWADGVGDVF